MDNGKKIPTAVPVSSMPKILNQIFWGLSILPHKSKIISAISSKDIPIIIVSWGPNFFNMGPVKYAEIAPSNPTPARIIPEMDSSITPVYAREVQIMVPKNICEVKKEAIINKTMTGLLISFPILMNKLRIPTSGDFLNGGFLTL